MVEKEKSSQTDPKIRRQRQVLFGGGLFLLGLLLIISFVSYYFNWKEDYSSLESFFDKSVPAKNILSKVGAFVSHLFIYQGVGFSSILFPYLLCLSGFKLFFDVNTEKILSNWSWGISHIIWLTVFLGYLFPSNPKYCGVVGYELNLILKSYVGEIGVLAILIFFFMCIVVIQLKWTPENIQLWWNKLWSENKTSENQSENFVESIPLDPSQKENEKNDSEIFKNSDVTTKKKLFEKHLLKTDELVMEVETAKEEETLDEKITNDLIKKQGFFDPTLELSKFKMPKLDLLKNYGETGIKINQEELEANKNKIVETLNNYKIGISNIKATIGPTVTLYEIVPDAGIRISKIKSLEDDIALSLSALGIRIIAPIPGKGTIGIEVPNQSPTIVSMRSVISSTKFQNAEMELPIALGKNISNETFVVDLVKMPHLLMAGATGQGKSVGLNAVLTSLIFKKHPAEVKFVLVDPKKVELNIYSKIERHYLAKLPDTEEAIITDNTKVINTLNSLCIEMDNRYELLKNAMCRNIKEYNIKFKQRKLNPKDGHNFLPYIILVVDEFADLIMTAGKEVETPIARLAQLARAIGIHLIIATQRPSVNVITGIIKANFPARIAFRVASKIDSRTILDNGGADQLIGRGDMLYTQGNELTRIQCAFVDTPEVESISSFVGSQMGFSKAHILPEYSGEENNSSIETDASERDSLFREAAEIIVTAQQGSASLLQRKLKLGYNRAGRIIDQMEAAGVVGPFEGSKARQVLIQDLTSLNRLLDDKKNNSF
tara:strand:- start:4132 stop:6456 length:2325 start_codon:yes stop_codon:yes gene_type:complete